MVGSGPGRKRTAAKVFVILESVRTTNRAGRKSPPLCAGGRRRGPLRRSVSDGHPFRLPEGGSLRGGSVRRSRWGWGWGWGWGGVAIAGLRIPLQPPVDRRRQKALHERLPGLARRAALENRLQGVPEAGHPLTVGEQLVRQPVVGFRESGADL